MLPSRCNLTTTLRPVARSIASPFFAAAATAPVSSFPRSLAASSAPPTSSSALRHLAAPHKTNKHRHSPNNLRLFSTTPNLTFNTVGSALRCANHDSSTPSSSSSSHRTNSTQPNQVNNQQNRHYSTMSQEQVSDYLKQSHDRIFENNKAWAETKRNEDPGFFAKLSAGQSPEYLWIGCSDSRIPAEQITGLQPGEAFIHRNIANLVPNIDLNVMSVINYAVRHLGVKHIVVCGHYGCGGVKAAMTPKDLGLLNPWLRNIRDVYRLHEAELDAIKDEEERYNRLVELNVVEQCRNVIKTAAVQQSYHKNQYPIVHGWVFGFKDGLLKDLKIDHDDMLKQVQKIYNLAE